MAPFDGGEGLCSVHSTLRDRFRRTLLYIWGIHPMEAVLLEESGRLGQK